MTMIHANPAPAPPASDELLAILAHELRDPLGALLFALDALPGDVGPDVRRAHSIARHQARRAAQIVDDLFDLCRASRDRLSLRKEVVQLADIVARATETTAHLLAARRHRLTVSFLPIRCGSSRCSQIYWRTRPSTPTRAGPSGSPRIPKRDRSS
jgi:signal transduction histidine kinase